MTFAIPFKSEAKIIKFVLQNIKFMLEKKQDKKHSIYTNTYGYAARIAKLINDSKHADEKKISVSGIYERAIKGENLFSLMENSGVTDAEIEDLKNEFSYLLKKY